MSLKKFVKSVNQLKNSLLNLESELKNLEYVIIQKDEKGYKKLLKKLNTLLVNTFDKKIETAIKHSLDYLESIGELFFNNNHLNHIQNIFQSEIGMDFPDIVNADVFTLNQQIYKFGIGEIGKSTGLKLAFDVADAEASAILGNHNLFWVQDYYTAQLQDDIDKILKPYFTSDKTIQEVMSDIQSKFSTVTNKGIDYFEGLAEHTTNRVRELGKITGYEKAGIIKYEIRAVMDDRTSDICLTMNGQIFEVSSGIDFRDTILGLDDPSSIKDVAPWRTASEISNLSTAELPPGMELPPYHWRCRTTTVAYFE